MYLCYLFFGWPALLTEESITYIDKPVLPMMVIKMEFCSVDGFEDGEHKVSGLWIYTISAIPDR